MIGFIELFAYTGFILQPLALFVFVFGLYKAVRRKNHSYWVGGFIFGSLLSGVGIVLLLVANAASSAV